MTLDYLAVLSLIYAALSLNVVRLRARNDIPFGDGDNPSLHRAIRAHGNFVEWVPLASILIAALETLGEAPRTIHLMMAALLAARILHPIAFASPLGSAPYYVGRIGGALGSWLVLSTAAVLLLMRG